MAWHVHCNILGAVHLGRRVPPLRDGIRLPLEPPTQRHWHRSNIQIAFPILFMFELYSTGMGLPSTKNPPLPSPTLITAPHTTLSSISTPVTTPHSNGTIAIFVPATTKSTSSTLMIAPAGYAMASSSPILASEPQSQPRWSPSAVGAIVFGCIASILGMLTLWSTTGAAGNALSSSLKRKFERTYSSKICLKSTLFL